MSEIPEVTPRDDRRVRLVVVVVLLLVLVVGTGVGAWLKINAPSSPSTHVGPEGVLIYDVPTLATADTTSTGTTVDGISCRKLTKEIVAYHVHVHVEIYVDGKMLRLPAGIGITSPMIAAKYPTDTFYDVGGFDCLYWLHTHVGDGVIHVESPIKKIFTLGEFFDIWRQPLDSNQVGPAKGHVAVIENGRKLSGNPRSAPLLAESEIQIDVGTPVVRFHPFIYKVTGGCGQGTLSCSSFKA